MSFTPVRSVPQAARQRARVLAEVRRALRGHAAQQTDVAGARWVDDAMDLVEANLGTLVTIARRCGANGPGAADALCRLVCGTCDHRAASGFCPMRYLDCCGVYASAEAIVGAIVRALRDEGERPAASTAAQAAVASEA